MRGIVGWAKKGTKHHVATYGDGLPATCVATATNVNGTIVFGCLFRATFTVMVRFRTAVADKGRDAKT